MTGRSEVIGLFGDYQLPISFLSISFSPETYEEPKKAPNFLGASSAKSS
jgi:hypothetical protein